MPTARQVLGKFKQKFFPPFHRSYAQVGEDLVADHLLRLLWINDPTYLDIGAHHAAFLSNTFYFYRRGCHGVCVEPDPKLFKAIQRARPRDICLNVGIGSRHEEKQLLVMGSTGLNTFLPEVSALVEEKGGAKLTDKIAVQILPANDLFAQYFKPWPNFVSMDTEGMDLEILRAIDFTTYRPELFCIETASFTDGEKDANIPQFMSTVGYVPVADTFLNSFYAENNAWQKRYR